MPPMQRVLVRSLVGELRSHKLHGSVKIKDTKAKPKSGSRDERKGRRESQKGKVGEENKIKALEGWIACWEMTL